MKKVLAAALILILFAGLFLWWRSRATGSSAVSDTAAPPQAAAAASPAVELGSCDQQPPPPQLPNTLSPASNEIGAIVAALDTALNEQQKAWLRCFPVEDEVLAKTHFGFGRWLRTTLRLRQPSALAALGATSSDEASSLIVLVYWAHLRGQTLSLDEARIKRAESLANAGVTP